MHQLGRDEFDEICEEHEELTEILQKERLKTRAEPDEASDLTRRSLKKLRLAPFRRASIALQASQRDAAHQIMWTEMTLREAFLVLQLPRGIAPGPRNLPGAQLRGLQAPQAAKWRSPSLMWLPRLSGRMPR
eukprot:4676082-Prymnesium_polylepis.1